MPTTGASVPSRGRAASGERPLSLLWGANKKVPCHSLEACLKSARCDFDASVGGKFFYAGGFLSIPKVSSAMPCVETPLGFFLKRAS